MRYALESFIARFFLFLLNLLPLETCWQIAKWLGHFLYAVMGKRRHVTLVNLERAFGKTLPESEKIRIAKASFENMALSVMELLLVERVLKEARQRFELHGNEHLEKAFAQGKGVILSISHLGSWEYLSFLPYLTGRPWSVVVKKIKNPLLDQKVDAARRKMTVVPIPKAGSIKTVMKELKSNRGVAILIDQWAGPEGLWLDFFGTPTATTSVPARLAKKTGAVIVPAYCLRKAAGHYSIEIHPAFEFDWHQPDWEEKATAELSLVLEKQILKYPDQWTWTHRRWKSKPAWTRSVSESFRAEGEKS